MTAKISIILPVYNEARSIKGNIAKLIVFLNENLKYEWELLVVDNLSTDPTSFILEDIAEKNANLRVIKVPVKGVGVALRAGWSASSGDILAYTDADLPFNLMNLKSLIDEVINGADVSVGSRYMKGGSYKTSLVRRFLSRSYVLWTSCLFQYKITDNCGTKALRRKSFEELLPFIRSDGWFFGTEIMVYAHKLGMNIREVPVQCNNNHSRPSSLMIFRTALLFLKLSISLRLRFAIGIMTNEH